MNDFDSLRQLLTDCTKLPEGGPTVAAFVTDALRALRREITLATADNAALFVFEMMLMDMVIRLIDWRESHCRPVTVRLFGSRDSGIGVQLVAGNDQEQLGTPPLEGGGL